MEGYIYICDEFVEAGLVFDDLKNRDKIIAEVKEAFRQCVGVEAEDAEGCRGRFSVYSGREARPIHPQTDNSRNPKRIEVLHQRHGDEPQAAPTSRLKIPFFVPVTGVPSWLIDEERNSAFSRCKYVKRMFGVLTRPPDGQKT